MCCTDVFTVTKDHQDSTGGQGFSYGYSKQILSSGYPPGLGLHEVHTVFRMIVIPFFWYEIHTVFGMLSVKSEIIPILV